MNADFKMPDGITRIRNVDLGVGPCLEVTLANGFTVLIDSLNLSGQHESQVGVYRTRQYESDGDAMPVCGMAFDPVNLPEVYVE